MFLLASLFALWYGVLLFVSFLLHSWPIHPQRPLRRRSRRPIVLLLRSARRGVSASVFKNDGNSDNSYFNVSIQNRYQDKETGEWKDSRSLLRDQLPVLEHLIRQAYAYILDQESARPAQEAE